MTNTRQNTDGVDGKGTTSNMRNAVETLANILYLIEVDPELPESIKRLLPIAETAMKTLREQARLMPNVRADESA